MHTMTEAQFTNQIAHAFDMVDADHAPIIITRKNGKAGVFMSMEDFKSYEETAHLMSSAKNAARLNEAILDIENGITISKGLILE